MSEAKHNAFGLEGCVSLRQSRGGPLIGIYEAPQSEIDDSAPGEKIRYQVVCENHSTVINVTSIALAQSTTGKDFCDGCRDDEPETESQAHAAYKTAKEILQSLRLTRKLTAEEKRRGMRYPTLHEIGLKMGLHIKKAVSS